MAVPGTLGGAVLALAGLVRPIQERFGPGGPRAFAAELGLAFPASIDTHAAMVDASGRAQQHLRAIPALADELVAATDDTAVVEKAVRLAAAVGLAIEAVGDVGDAFRTAGAGSGIPAAELDPFAASFSARVLDYLLVAEAEARPGISEALLFIGAIERTDVPAGDALHPAYVRRTVHLDQLTAFLGNPAAVLAARYGWGTPGFTGVVLFATLAKVLRGMGVPVIEDTSGGAPVLDVVFVELSPRDDVTPSGVAVTVTNPLPPLPLAHFDGGDWQVTIVAMAPPPVGTQLLLQANDDITVTLPENARFDGRLAIEITAAPKDGVPFVLLGEAGGSRLEARELSATAGVGLRFDPATGHATGSFGLGGEVRGLKLIVDASKGDGFLGTLLAGARLETGFDLSFTIDTENGLQLGGSGGLEVQVPVHLELGPLEVQTVYLAVRFADGRVPVELSAGFAASLGPIQAVVERMGVLEVDKSRLWFFAQLFDSHVLTMTIEGGMGLLVVWGDNPDFVLSVGGFHPAFTPPPLPFPVPPRICVDILNSPGRLIRVTGYFAVTSNTVQFGAKAELRLGFGGFGIEGHLSFDALFRFSPFSFIVEISAGVSLKAFGVGLFGIDLNFTLEGPAPWRAHGRGSISLLFFEISADFDITWGEERTTTLPPVAVLAMLEGEVRKTEGWQTRLPAGGANPMVTLRQLPPGDDLVLHPLGTLFIHQRAIPLGVRIDRVGAQRPSDGKRFTVTPAQNSGLVRRSVTGDKFAMAQFQDMNDAAKLSRPAYETQDAGLELVAAGGAIASPRVVRCSARYELHIIDNEAPSEVTAVRATAVRATTGRTRGRLYTPPPAVFGQLLAGSSTARSPLSQQEAQQRQPFTAEGTVRVPGSRYVVAYLRNNQQAFPPATASATTSSFRSAATAEDAMTDWIHADPSLAGQLHVLRQAEIVGGVLAESGVWSSAGSPPAAVAGADAVRLSSGQVLVVGGAGATGTAVTTAALFDPIAGTWATQAAPLAAARRRHTATRLGDGRVVVAGGLGADGGSLASVEVFDPVAGTWSTPGTGLVIARSGQSATIAGKRLLVAGGTSARGAALASAELLDPITLTWTAVGSLTDARTGHAAVPLGTGKVLVVGGAVPTGEGVRALTSCELYDPETKTWTLTGSLAVPRKGHQATLLPDGRVLVTGGDAVPAIPYRVDSLAAAEVYDPKTGVWTRVDDLPGGGRSGHRCVRTPRGAVVIGGVGRPRATAGFRDVVAFDLVTGSWTATGALATGRWDFPAVDLADGRVLAVGGRALAGPAAPGADQLATTAETYLP